MDMCTVEGLFILFLGNCIGLVVGMWLQWSHDRNSRKDNWRA